MILGKNIHPEHQLYYWGAIVLGAIEDCKEDKVEYLTVFQMVKEHHFISNEVFLLTLDWLFLLGAIDQEDGLIIQCS